MARSPHLIKRLHGQRGAATIWFALCLPVLLAFAAMALDLARINLARTELQNAADAAALGGVRSLSDPSAVASDQPYNWSAAEATARAVVQRNYANGALVQDALIDKGYWNVKTPSLGFRPLGTSGVPVAGDVPAIRATVSIDSTKNNGPLKLFFAPILGIAESNVQASAIAMIAPPSGGTGIFPLVISKKMLDLYWDLTNKVPLTKEENGEPYPVEIGSSCQIGTGSNATSILTGQWTTFGVTQNDVQFIRTLIGNGNSTPLHVGDYTYIQPGVEVDLYKAGELPVGMDVAIFVVDEVVTKSCQKIIAVAGFHITGSNQEQKTITGHFIKNMSAGGTDPGDGTGVPYGAYTPPTLVE